MLQRQGGQANALAFALRGHRSEPTALCFLPAASAATDSGAVADPPVCLAGQRASVQRPWLVSGDADGFLFLWDLGFRRPVRCWQPHTGGIGGVIRIQAFSAGGRLLFASQGRNNKLLVWDLQAIVSCSASAAGHSQDQSQEPAPVFSLDTNSISFCQFAATVVSQLEGHSEPAAKTVLFAVPNLLDPALIDVFNYTAGRFTRRRIGEDLKPSKALGLAMCLCFVHRQQSGTALIAAGYESGSVLLWSLAGENLVSMKLHSEPVMGIDIAPNGLWGVSVSADDHVAHFSTLAMPASGEAADAASNAHSKPALPAWHSVSKMQSAGMSDTRIHPATGNLVATAGWNGIVHLWIPSQASTAAESHETAPSHATTLQSAGGFSAHKQSIRALAFVLLPARQPTTSSPSTLLAVGSKDGKISLWTC